MLIGREEQHGNGLEGVTGGKKGRQQAGTLLRATQRPFSGPLTLPIDQFTSKQPENILLDRDGHVRLADFGLSKEGPCLRMTPGGEGEGILRTRTFCGTPEYLAPEVLLNRSQERGYTQAVDWWSLGVVCFEVLHGFPPFYDRDFTRMCRKILRKPLRFHPLGPAGAAQSKLPTVAQAFLRGLLERNPARRLGNSQRTGHTHLNIKVRVYSKGSNRIRQGASPPPTTQNK